MENPDILRMVPLVPDTVKTPPSTTITAVITKEVLPMEKQMEARKCSRYQFECRSTGECIAIYNACDGIAQCADGSDEAHELGCPAPEAVASVATQTTPVSPSKKLLPMPVHQVQTQPQQYGREGEMIQQPKLSSNNYQPLYHPHAQIPQIPLQQEADFLRPISDPRSSGRAQYEPGVPVQNYLGMPNNWNVPRQSQVMQPVQQLPPYQENTNRIFPHKDGSPHNEPQISQIQYSEYAGRVPNYYGENYRQPIQQENWPAEEVRYPLQQQQNYHPDSVAPIPAKTEGNSHIAEAVQDNTHNNPSPSETVVNPKHVQEKLAHDLKHSKDNMEHGSNQKVIMAKVKNSALHEQYPDVVAYKMADDTQDGLSHIPRGAILSLTLGLIITGVMAILIGCRLRVVRRRLRKGGKGYAHDADYLVNGMYL